MKKTSIKSTFLIAFLGASNLVCASEYPSKELRAFTKCTDAKITDVITGYSGDYTFQQGMSKEKRSGLIKREPAKVEQGCFLPTLAPHQIAYFEIDAKKYDEMHVGNSSYWTMQCVRSAKPTEGVLTEKEPKSEASYKVDYLSGKAMMLHCGHTEAHADVCADGSNSTRSGEWDKHLAKRNKKGLSIHATQSTLAPKGGEKIYCHYYNKETNKSLFAFEYTRKP